MLVESSSIIKISPVQAGIARPLWSVMIPTYNCAQYLHKTLASVLAQDPGPDMMQIMVVDDFSTQDNPEIVVKEVGKGRVEFYRQTQNVGAPINFQTCLEMSRGYLIHQLHGDDYVKDGFYQKIGQAFNQYPEIGAAFCRNIFVDEYDNFQRFSRLEMAESGILSRDEWLKKIASINLIQTPAMVVKRDVYEKLGGFNLDLAGTEDWEMWVRIALVFPIWYEVNPLAVYRIRSQSLSQSTINSGFFPQQLYKAIHLMQSYLPKYVPKKVFQISKQNCAFISLGVADSLIKEGQWQRAITQIQAALRYSSSYRVLRSASRIILLTMLYLLFTFKIKNFWFYMLNIKKRFSKS